MVFFSSLSHPDHTRNMFSDFSLPLKLFLKKICTFIYFLTVPTLFFLIIGFLNRDREYTYRVDFFFKKN